MDGCLSLLHGFDERVVNMPWEFDGGIGFDREVLLYPYNFDGEIRFDEGVPILDCDIKLMEGFLFVRSRFD